MSHSHLPGFEVPLYRALTDPILLGGAPRGIAILNGTLGSGLGAGSQALDRRSHCLGGGTCHCGGSGAERRAVRGSDLPPCPTSGESVMLNLTEYAKKPKLLADYLPWGFLVGPGIVLNKDGSFLRLAKYRGPDLESATEAELIGVTARINNVLKRFGSGWALFFEARRYRGVPLSDVQFPGPGFVAGG